MKFEKGAPPVPEAERSMLEKFQEANREIHALVDGLSVPLGHGTTSEFLDDILKKGLGAAVPKKAFAGTKNATDLRESDGLMGAYLFARFNTGDLQITSEKTSGETAVDRYVRLNTKISADSLREAFVKYKEKREPEGFPVLFIYEGKNLQIVHTNPHIPSEVEFKETISTDRINAILVPEPKILEVSTLLEQQGLSSIRLLPIEALEVGD